MTVAFGDIRNTMDIDLYVRIKDGLALGTELNCLKFYIYGRYCMNPSCKCVEVILHYVEYREEKRIKKVADYGVELSLKNPD
jgi:hypothetical protein